MKGRHDTSPELTEDVIALAKMLNQDIDADLGPIISSGTIILDGRTATNISGKKLMGDVNIGNRILTNDTVTLLGNGKYKVSPACRFFHKKNEGESETLTCSATIDGKAYTGKKILIDKKQVTVKR